ncbi:MAG: RIP metalloprotease RseP [Lachnospira sp.]|nr:RIP metalloprotease RseP [Lachnospira sp.]
MNILLALLVLGIVIFIHEFGHFIVAKANGVTVVEFSIGFGPKIIHFKKGETEYCLKLIPFGGACTMLGDDLLVENINELEEDDEDNNSKASDNIDEKKSSSDILKEKLKDGYDSTKSFANKSVWSRIAIIAAGPIFNFLLAFVFAIVIIGSVGVDPCYISVVDEGSPAAKAGLAEGDKILKINSNNISVAREYTFHTYYYGDKTMNITYERDGKKQTATVTPELRHTENYRVGIMITTDNVVSEVIDDSPAKTAGLKAGDLIVSVDGRALSEKVEIGDVLAETKTKEVAMVVKRDGKEVSLNITPQLVEEDGYYSGLDCYGFREKVGPTATVGYAAKEVMYWIETVVKSVGMMFTGKVGINDLSGPVGVVDAVNTVVEQSKPDGTWYVILNLINFMVMISANLGVMNLLPLPALDGGRLVFMFIELVRGKPIKKEHEGMVHFVGIILLMILMVYVLIKDIIGLF